MDNKTLETRHPIHKLIIPCSTLLFVGVTWLLWPYYQYYVDMDAISYLSLVKYYISGNFHQAINAFWSPMGCWLTALCVDLTHWPLFASAIFTNAIGGLGSLVIGQILFFQFRKSSFERWCFAITTAFFYVYVIYIQSFTDVWQCFFLLMGLLLLLKKDFENKPIWWLVLGLIGALSYFSKAYSFYFFPLMIILVTGIKMAQKKDYRFKKHLIISVVSIGFMMVVTFPWLYLLHQKYGFWTPSTAGTLNLTWFLEGTQHLKKGITVLVPPPHKTSLFYFEDPFLVQGTLVHFWDSPTMFVKFLARIAYNALLWIVSSNRLSPFYFFIWLLCLLKIFRKKITFFKNSSRLLVIIFLIFPLPYWILTFDQGRYLWFTLPLSMIIGLILFENILFNHLKKRATTIFILVFFLSYLVSPILDLKENFKSGAKEYQMAQKLIELNIKGSFASNLSYEEGRQEVHFISWFSGNPWYCHRLDQYNTAEILKDANRYRVKYYFYFYNGSGEDYQLKHANGENYPELTEGKIPGLKVFAISPKQ